MSANLVRDRVAAPTSSRLAGPVPEPRRGPADTILPREIALPGPRQA